MSDKINDIDEFVQSVIASTPEQIRDVFYNRCTSRLQGEILDLAPNEAIDHLQSACRILGNWNNIPALQNFV